MKKTLQKEKNKITKKVISLSKDDIEIVIRKVTLILNIGESPKNSTNKMLIKYVENIFNEGFTKNDIVLSIRKKEGEEFKYLSTFVKILHELFISNSNDRDTLYRTKKIRFRI